ncbi:hypothetical protein OFY17_12610 [Marinomonas sp. C2222]|uniref:Uncharacterized protein n=1 Tax=Marinomonas sargassi TaxID=2984494 RepID=A0ABT2YV01_9GAMM|nr:hypothetical protein [Marinomonas sargassi]MCV2403714.1 hypothetical protein [Marinomonas sargassi]
MTNNLIPFPKTHRRNVNTGQKVSKDELVSLRKAFDKARQGWPLEIAELPENNKMYYAAKK